ncbi:hypothetical protein PCK2_000763 [Pneumocystis canis]|nr:hypothetical protein PCK2_000763 [Pneumocystis canis]
MFKQTAKINQSWFNDYGLISQLRESIRASRRLDAFTCEVYETSIRVGIYMNHVESYLPAMQYLIDVVYPALLRSFSGNPLVTCYLLYLACGISDLHELYEVKRRLQIHSQDLSFRIARMMVENNYVGWWRLRNQVSWLYRRMIDQGRASMQERCVRVISAAYYKISRQWVESYIENVSETTNWIVDGDQVYPRKSSITHNRDSTSIVHGYHKEIRHRHVDEEDRKRGHYEESKHGSRYHHTKKSRKGRLETKKRVHGHSKDSDLQDKRSLDRSGGTRRGKTESFYETEETACSVSDQDSSEGLKPSLMDEEALIEQRRKNRDAILAKYRGQQTPLVNSQPKLDTLVMSSPDQDAQPSGIGSSQALMTEDCDFQLTKETSTLHNIQDGQAAADYDPMVDGRLDEERQQYKRQFSSIHFDEHFNFISMEKDKVTGNDIAKVVAISKPVRDLRSRLSSHLSTEDPKLMKNFIDLLERCLDLDPERRLTAYDALKHPFIRG